MSDSKEIDSDLKYDTVGWNIYYNLDMIPDLLIDKNEIANPNEDWNSTDVISHPLLPWKKLKFAGEKNGIWIINYHQSYGIARVNLVIVASIVDDRLTSLEKGALDFFLEEQYNFQEVLKELNSSRVKFRDLY